MLRELHQSVALEFKKQKLQRNELLDHIKHSYFDLLNIIIKYYPITTNGKMFLIFFELLQILSYPFGNNFEYIWENTSLYKLFNILFTYCKITSIFKGSTHMYIIVYYFIIIIIFTVFGFLIGMIYYMRKSSVPSISCVKILAVAMPTMANVFYIPIVNILISIFNCDSSGLNPYGNNFECWSVSYIIHASIGSVALLIFLFFSSIVINTFLEPKNNKNSALAKREVYIEIVIVLAKTFTCVTCTFVTGFNVIRVISILNYLFYCYIGYYITYHNTIYYSFKIQKTYKLFSYISSWGFMSLLIGALATKEKNTIKDNLFVYIFIVGSIVLFFGVALQNKKIRYYNMTRPLSYAKSPKEFVELIEELMFLTLNKDAHRDYQIMLNGYIHYNLDKTTFLQIEDIQLGKYFDSQHEEKKGYIFLFLQINTIYQFAISKFPLSSYLRIHYAIFLSDYLSRNDQALIELTNASRFHLTLSEEFVIYQLSKSLEGQYANNSNELLNTVDLFTNLSYKGMSKKFKTLINKVSLLYVDFWSLLSSSDHESQEELTKLNNIGTKINDLVENIHNIFRKMQKISPYDIDIITEYSQFTSEILNDKKTSDEYKLQLIDLGTESKNIVDEANLCHLDLNTIVQNDEYQCVIYSAMAENLGTITHISLSLCIMLGYTKDEILGKQIEVLLPESFEKSHRKYLKALSSEYKKKFLNDYNQNLNFEIKFKEANIFFRNKSRYLIPLHVKTAFFPSENNTQYFITRILNENSSTTYNPNNYSCYVLTNSHLVIQNFSSNAINFLCLQSNSLNKAKEITENIKQFNEDYLRYLVDIEGEEENENKNIRKVLSGNFSNFNQYQISKKAKNDDKETLLRKTNLKHEIIRKKYSSPTPITWIKTGNNSMEGERKANQDENFVLTVSDVKDFGEFLGFIFKFEPIWYWNLYEKTSMNNSIRDFSGSPRQMRKYGINPGKSSSNAYIDEVLTYSPEKASIKYLGNNLNIESSMMINKNFLFGEIKIDKNFVPEIGKKFAINPEQISFVQNDTNKMDVDKMRNALRKQAENKINVQSQEEENKSSSDISSVYTSNYSSSFRMSSSEKKSEEAKKDDHNFTGKNQLLIDSNTYYHVNLSKIKLYLYDYKKRIIYESSQNENKSQIEIKFNEDSLAIKAQTLSNTSKEQNNNYSGKHRDRFYSFRQRKGIKNEKNDNPIPLTAVSQEEILKKEIEVALKRNDSSKSIVLLHILSLFALFIIIAKAFIFAFVIVSRIDIIEDGVALLETAFNMLTMTLMGVYYSRELTLVNIDEYETIISNKTKYFEEHISALNSIFIGINEYNSKMIISHIQLSDKDTAVLDEKAGVMFYVNDDLEVENITTRFKTVVSTVNIALFHIMNTTLSQLYTTNKDVFFFIYNAQNGLYLGHRQQIEFIKDKIDANFDRELVSIIIIFSVCEMMLIGAYFSIRVGLKSVSVKKNSYLTVFFEIGKKVILKSLSKCEKFSARYQNENKNHYSSSNDLASETSSLSDKSEYIINEAITTQTDQRGKVSKPKNKNYSSDIFSANKQFIFLLIYILIFDSLILILVLIYYNQTNYSVQIYLSENNIQKYAIIAFNLLREYMIDSNASFSFLPLKTIIPFIFQTIYKDFQSQRQTIRNSFRNLPSFFYENYYKINGKSICYIGEESLKKYFPETTCDEFTGSSAELGLDKLLMYYFEDIRSMIGLTKNLNNVASELGFKYNYTLYGTKEYNDYIPEDESMKTEYQKYSPMILFNSNIHRHLAAMLRFYIRPSFDELIAQIMKGIIQNLDRIEKVINIGVFCNLSEIILLYFFVWIPFIRRLNTSIYKTKNMLTIIPRDVLASVWNIQKLLDITANIDQVTMKGGNSFKGGKFRGFNN